MAGGGIHALAGCPGSAGRAVYNMFFCRKNEDSFIWKVKSPIFVTVKGSVMKREGLRGAGSVGYNRLAGSRMAGSICWLIGIVGFFAVSCSHFQGRGNDIAVVADTTGLRDGDLLFRLGNGPESRLVTTASRGVYSHVGIVTRVGGQWMAVHAVPGENGDRNGPDTLKCEPIAEFFRPGRAVAGAVARIACPDSTAHAAAVYALEKVRARVLFDHHYRMTDTTELYCTELVYLAYLHQGVDLTGCRESIASFPVSGERYIFPSDLQNGSAVDYLQEFRTRLVEAENH